MVPSPQNDPNMISWGPNMLPQGDHAALQEITQAPHQGPMGESSWGAYHILPIYIHPCTPPLTREMIGKLDAPFNDSQKCGQSRCRPRHSAAISLILKLTLVKYMLPKPAVSLGPLWGALWAQHVIPGDAQLVPRLPHDPRVPT